VYTLLLNFLDYKITCEFLTGITASAPFRLDPFFQEFPYQRLRPVDRRDVGRDRTRPDQIAQQIKKGSFPF